ncbi:MAG: polyprenyl synthetase family protein, partial [Thermoproteota archaeon]
AQKDELMAASELLIKTGSIVAAEDLARFYTDRAVSALKQLPENAARVDLESIAYHMTKRRA